MNYSLRVTVNVVMILLLSFSLNVSEYQWEAVEVSAVSTEASHSNFETIVWLSDTQYYAERYPHIFQHQINWIIQNRKVWNIRYVIHTGDIVNNASKKIQWLRASHMFKQLEKQQIPYGVLAGNHDLVKGKSYEKFAFYFGERRFIHQPYYQASYQNNRGHYDVMEIGNQPFIFLYMGWDIAEKEIEWMNHVLAEHQDKVAVLAFHKYLHKSKRRTFEGKRIFNEVVKKNENVRVVLSGHYDDSEHIVTEIDDDKDGSPDRSVYEILADYQGAPEGGQGFLRLLHYYPESDLIYVRTYSPYLDQYYYYSPFKYPGKDEFWIDLSK
ncbi:metallophosphoesterase [Bacillus kexueae]|uniref:metallophosphoesterase n=1 Tax=Aeribacillus kexueae TaxID=2078952 RepID=UPI001FAEF687|nr:metallophosphoesterase [Bacillus kexueae]